jgi:DNA polymerase III epsilon subunit family exonuclease
MNDIFVSLDLETTGLDPVNDEIIEIGAVKFDRNGVIDTYQSMVKPSRPVPYRIQILTGITDRDLVKAPKLPVALNELVDFLGNATIIGQNIGFDLAFLAKQDVAPRGEVYDVFEMAIIVMPALTDYRLATLAAELGVSSVQYHRALHDATAAKDVFLALLDKLRSFDPSIIAELDRIGASRDWPLGRLFHAVSDEKLGDVFSIAGEPALKIYELSKESGCAPKRNARRLTSIVWCSCWRTAGNYRNPWKVSSAVKSSRLWRGPWPRRLTRARVSSWRRARARGNRSLIYCRRSFLLPATGCPSSYPPTPSACRSSL